METEEVSLVPDHHPRLHSWSGVLLLKINIIPVSLAILFFSYVNQRSRYLSGDVDTITIRTGTWFDNNVPEEELNDRPIIGNMSRHEK